MSSTAPMARVEVDSTDTAFAAEAAIVAGQFVLRVAGEVDFANASTHSTAPLDAAFAATDARDVVVDLSEVTFIDSGGLSWLVRIRAAASSRGGTVRLVGASPRIERVLRISGVLPLFAA